jgi:prepilin-type processing-associated H-X9-DG protein
VDWRILACPSDRFGVAGYFASATNFNRSYIINGFDDYFKKNLSAKDYQTFQQWRYAQGMRMADIPNPADTILFGEKKIGSRQVHMDIDQGQHGNDIDEIDHTRHGSGSNFGFADGSVRLIPKGGELYPQNLWSVTEETRYPPAPPAALK